MTAWDTQPWYLVVCFSVFLLLCVVEGKTLGLRLGRREQTDKKDLANWKHATDGPPCCWELTWELSSSCLFPRVGQPGYHQGS